MAEKSDAPKGQQFSFEAARLARVVREQEVEERAIFEQYVKDARTIFEESLKTLGIDLDSHVLQDLRGQFALLLNDSRVQTQWDNFSRTYPQYPPKPSSLMEKAEPVGPDSYTLSVDKISQMQYDLIEIWTSLSQFLFENLGESKTLLSDVQEKFKNHLVISACNFYFHNIPAHDTFELSATSPDSDSDTGAVISKFSQRGPKKSAG